ncbi:MAG: SHD1 domain-containing protein, partial [Planctomycetota bacterium]|nr:SHD1 domain-containing protein [Planctomycetota bacterium]
MSRHDKPVVAMPQQTGKLLTIVCVLLALSVTDFNGVDARIWKDATGKHEIDAEFVKFENGKAHLKTAAGKQMAVSLNKLSREDQEFVRAELRRLRQAEGGDVKPRRRVRKQPKATPLLEL